MKYSSRNPGSVVTTAEIKVTTQVKTSGLGAPDGEELSGVFLGRKP